MSEQEQAQAAAEETVETKQDNTETAETEEKGILTEAMDEGTEETSTEEKSTEEKPAEESKEVPESYDLKAPEGSDLGENDLKRLAETAKERGYTQEQAEQLVKDEAAHEARRMEQFRETTNEWKEASKNDPKIGGKNWDRTLKRGDSILAAYGPEGFGKMLKDSGMIYNPMLLEFLDDFLVIILS